MTDIPLEHIDELSDGLDRISLGVSELAQTKLHRGLTDPVLDSAIIRIAAAGKELTEHLLELGARDIALEHTPISVIVYGDRVDSPDDGVSCDMVDCDHYVKTTDGDWSLGVDFYTDRPERHDDDELLVCCSDHIGTVFNWPRVDVNTMRFGETARALRQGSAGQKMLLRKIVGNVSQGGESSG